MYRHRRGNRGNRRGGWHGNRSGNRRPPLDRRYGFFRCQDCDSEWESSHVYCIKGTDKVRHVLINSINTVTVIFACCSNYNQIIKHRRNIEVTVHDSGTNIIGLVREKVSLAVSYSID